MAVARFFKTAPGQYGEGDQFLGLTVPQQRTIAAQLRSLALQEVEQLLQSPWHECRSVGLIIWTLQFKKATAEQQRLIYDSYLCNLARINNWDLVDLSCPTIVGGYLLSKERQPLYELAATPHLWSQRVAIVATFTFIRHQQFADTFALAEILLTHPHDLIHKAVGWMLREVGKRNEEALEEFLHDHRHKMPRTTLRYAIERLPPPRRAFFMQK